MTAPHHRSPLAKAQMRAPVLDAVLAPVPLSQPRSSLGVSAGLDVCGAQVLSNESIHIPIQYTL